jgi:hypothetical protein
MTPPTTSTIGTLAILAAVLAGWVAAAVLVYRWLRRRLIGARSSTGRCMVFGAACGALLAPAVASGGHALIPLPVGALPFAALGLWLALDRRAGEDGLASFWINIASWIVTSAVIAGVESWRSRRVPALPTHP